MTVRRIKFENWIKDKRVSVDLRKQLNGEYYDLDTEWLWAAFDAGWINRSGND